MQNELLKYKSQSASLTQFTINAIGGNFFGSNFSANPINGTTFALTFTETNGNIFSTTLSNTTRDSFFGYLGDSTMSSLSVLVVQNPAAISVWPSIDNLVLGQAPAVSEVAEPEPLSVLLLSVMGLLLVRSKQKHLMTNQNI